jgi:hypothetical protein
VFGVSTVGWVFGVSTVVSVFGASEASELPDSVFEASESVGRMFETVMLLVNWVLAESALSRIFGKSEFPD